MSAYAKLIREDLAALGLIGRYDPRHIEAWMRSEHGVLDSLDKVTFKREVALAATLVDVAGLAESEALALSYGFAPVELAGRRAEAKLAAIARTRRPTAAETAEARAAYRAAAKVTGGES